MKELYLKLDQEMKSVLEDALTDYKVNHNTTEVELILEELENVQVQEQEEE